MKAMELIKTMEEMQKTVFTINDIARIIKKDKKYAILFVHRLKNNGMITQVERGKYVLAKSNPFSIASNLVYPCYISFISAFSYYGLTTQIPRKIYVVSLKAKKSLSFDNYEFIFIKFKRKRFFGYKRERLARGFVFIAEIEKAIIDSLFMPANCSIDETVEALKKANKEKLLEYGLKMQSKIVLKRLGFILEKIGVDVYEELKDKISKKYELLDPSLPKNGQRNKKWRLIVNRRI